MEMVQKKFGEASSSASSTSKGTRKETKETSYYNELESEREPLINVWISSIMHVESENYDLASGDVRQDELEFN